MFEKMGFIIFSCSFIAYLAGIGILIHTGSHFENTWSPIDVLLLAIEIGLP